MIRHCLTPLVLELTSTLVPSLPQLDLDSLLVGLTCWSLRTRRRLQVNGHVNHDGAKQLALEFSIVLEFWN
jgi:hypothetical protein